LDRGLSRLDDRRRPGVHVAEMHDEVVRRPARTTGDRGARVGPGDRYGEPLGGGNELLDEVEGGRLPRDGVHEASFAPLTWADPVSRPAPAPRDNRWLTR